MNTDGNVKLCGINSQRYKFICRWSICTRYIISRGQIPVPSATEGTLSAFFRHQHQTVQPTKALANSFNAASLARGLSRTNPLLAAISAQLKLPDPQGLTRSEWLFSIATQSDIQALTIKENEEFYLFMDMRAENGWASFNLTSQK